MKKLKGLFAPIFALLLTTSAFANTNPIKNSDLAKDELRKIIAKKIKSLDLSNLQIKDNDVKIQFTINDENEIIVLRTDNKELDKLVKSSLNYRETGIQNLSKNTLYSISIKLVS